MAGERNHDVTGGGSRRPLRRLLYTILEAAEMLNIGRTKMYELLGAGEIRSLHIDRAHRIEASAIEEFIKKKRDGDDETAEPPDDQPGPTDETGPTDSER